VETQTDKATGTVFPCTCNGCRDYPRDYSGIWQWGQIPDKLGGHYFDRDTRRFFASRILGWRADFSDGALAVRESSAGDMDNTFRVHRVVVFCRFGSLVERIPDALADGYRTGAQAARVLHGLPNMPSAACTCHGCTLDRDGRRTR